jgi:hypothetical protein
MKCYIGITSVRLWIILCALIYTNTLLRMAHSAQAIYIGTEVTLYSARQAPFAPFRVTTNKLEKVFILN